MNLIESIPFQPVF